MKKLKHLKIFEDYSQEELDQIRHQKEVQRDWQYAEESGEVDELQPEEEEEEEAQSSGPDFDDIVISSNGWKYSIGSEDHGFIGEFEEWDDAVKAVKEWMKKNNWYPNIWTMSDHGNLDGPYSIDDLEKNNILKWFA